MDCLTNATAEVRKFHRTFLHPNPDVPTMIPFDKVQIRAKWIREETEELVDPAKQTLEDQVDATLDIIYFALGNMVELGVDPTPLFRIVNDANMAKADWPDGKGPRWTAEGKVMKPPGWVAPEPKLRAEIARQIKEAAALAKQGDLFHE